MSVAANRRSIMTLFSQPDDPQSHRVRVVMAEKNVNYDIVELDTEAAQAELVELNPYNVQPTLVDRDLVLYEPRVICEYVDERFPHPPLMPVDPVQRATFRLAMYRIEQDWYGQYNDILTAKTDRAASKARKILRETVTASNEIFEMKPFFMNEEYSLVDATLAPILWRLQEQGIELPDTAKAVKAYADKIFDREGFQNSLSEIEREMQDYM